jgi:biotin carboxyl carrier protein
MKFETRIDGRAVTLELEQSDGKVEARVGDRSYEARVLQPEPGVYTILIGSEVYETRVWSISPGSIRVHLKNHVFSVDIIDRKHRRAEADHGPEGRQNLLAPMPGKVVRVLLSAGDTVAAGQGVVVVEAMKMQNEVKSPKAGTVLEVRVSAGDTVNANQVLAVVE